MRIASLLASATEIVAALGLEERLVAISHECDYPASVLDRPRVSRPRFDPEGQSAGAIDAAVRSAMAEHGSVYRLDADRLRAVSPDLILTQAVCEVCAVPTSLAQEAAEALDGRPAVLSLDSHSMEDIFQSILAVGDATESGDRASRLVARFRSRLDAVRRAVAGRTRVSVLAIEWLDPPFLPGHWTPEMVEVAGGELLGAAPGAPSQQTDWDTLADYDPDVLVIMPCGYDLAASIEEAKTHAGRIAGVATRAVASGRAFVVDGSAYFNRSGPRMVDGVEILGALLHPDVFREYDFSCKAAVFTLPGP
jgi:iron complex transport system substrate-binding protein